MHVVVWIIGVLLSLAAGYWVYRADIRRAVPNPWLTALLRSLVVLLTFLLLVAPLVSITNKEVRKPVIFFLQDNSQSIPFALKSDTAVYEKNARELIRKLSDKYRVITWGFGGTVQKDTLFRYKEQSTDIAAALSKAIEFYGQQNLGAVILATDGRFNQGINPQFQDLALQGSLYTVALGDSIAQKDLRVTQVYGNRTVSLNSQFELRADIVAQMAGGNTTNVQLREVNGPASASSPLNISTDRFDKSVSFTLKADRAGMHHYSITIPPADGETNTSNNRKDIFVEVVSEKKSILIAAAAPHPDINAIREALSGLEGYNVVVRTGNDIPASFADYQVVILHQLPSTAIPLKQLAGTKKSIWFILGGQSRNDMLNQQQTLARLNVNPGNLQNQFAAYNTAFSGFTMPQNINAVMDKMPPLAAPAGTIQASPDIQTLFSAKGNANMPLWMLRQGQTPMAILAGEGIWRWRLFEYRFFNQHTVIDEAIRQTVSFLSVNNNERPFRVELPKYVWSDQEPVVFNAYLLNANNEQVSTPDVQLTITDSAGARQSFSFERAGNTYRLNIGLRASGTYSFTGKAIYNGKTYTASGSFVVQNMPVEMMETGADYPLLHALAGKYNGSMVPSRDVQSLYDSIVNQKNIRPEITATEDTVPLIDWKWYFFLILIFAAAEWLLRKYWLAQ